MIVGILNIRGGCSKIKRKRISSIIKQGQTDIFMLQETKMEEFSECLAISFWGGEQTDFSFSPSVEVTG